jgi:hypothetical protein
MSALLDIVATVLKRLAIALFLVGGLLLGMLIALKVLIVMSIVHLVRRGRGARPKPVPGNVFEGEYSVVKPGASRATVLMAAPSKPVSPAP